VKKMCTVFLRMIKMFYNNQTFEVFMAPKPPRGMEWAVNNLVAGNTKLGWKLWIQVGLFYVVCALQKHFTMAPRLDLSETAKPRAAALRKT
jgi:hypothetical protein